MPRGSLKQRESPKEKLRERERVRRSVRGGFAPRPGSGSALRARRMEASRRWQLACVARVHCAHSMHFAFHTRGCFYACALQDPLPSLCMHGWSRPTCCTSGCKDSECSTVSSQSKIRTVSWCNHRFRLASASVLGAIGTQRLESKQSTWNCSKSNGCPRQSPASSV